MWTSNATGSSWLALIALTTSNSRSMLSRSTTTVADAPGSGAELERGADDGGQCSERSARNLRQIVAGDVLHDPPACLRQLAVGRRELNADHQITRRPEAMAVRTAVVRRDQSTDGRLVGERRIERKPLTVRRKVPVQLLQPDARFCGHREIAGLVVDDAVQARHVEQHVDRRGPRAPAQFRALAADHDRKALPRRPLECGSNRLASPGRTTSAGRRSSTPSRAGSGARVSSWWPAAIRSAGSTIRSARRARRVRRDARDRGPALLRTAEELADLARIAKAPGVEHAAHPPHQRQIRVVEHARQYCDLSAPMPCSPVSDPPASTQYPRISAATASACSGCPGTLSS